MAKVIGPLHSTEARGVIGGLIYNSWRGIRYVKRMTSPAQPRHATALWLRSLAIRLVRQWQTLTTTAKNDWTDYANAHLQIDWTGIGKRLTGCNWFVGLNTRLLLINKTVVTTPPTAPAPDAVAGLSIAAGIAKAIITWTPTIGSGLSLMIFHFGPHSKGLVPSFEKASYFAVVAGEAGTYDAGVSQIGRHTYWVCTVDETNGLISPYQRAYTDVSALV
jgi:hypothetical protein